MYMYSFACNISLPISSRIIICGRFNIWNPISSHSFSSLPPLFSGHKTGYLPSRDKLM